MWNCDTYTVVGGFADERFAVDLDAGDVGVLEGDCCSWGDDVTAFAVHEEGDGFVGVEADGVVVEVGCTAGEVESVCVIDVAEDAGVAGELFVFAREVDGVSDAVGVFDNRAGVGAGEGGAGVFGIVGEEDRGDGSTGIGGVEVFADEAFAPTSEGAVFEFYVLWFGCEISCEVSVGFFSGADVPGVVFAGVDGFDFGGCWV